ESAGLDVRDRGTDHATVVYAVVLVEAAILDGEERGWHMVRQGIERDDGMVDRSEIGELLAGGVEQHRRAAGLVGRQPLDVRAATDPAALPQQPEQHDEHREAREQAPAIPAKPTGTVRLVRHGSVTDPGLRVAYDFRQPLVERPRRVAELGRRAGVRMDPALARRRRLCQLTADGQAAADEPADAVHQ